MPGLNKYQQHIIKLLPTLAFCIVFLCYFLIFDAFFPNQKSTIGHDYSLGFPTLLDASFWHKNNSFLSVPWFTPAFCGGVPFFADSGSGYYSLPTFLAFHFDPLTSTRLSIFLYAAIGFWGMYHLVRDAFGVGKTAAFLGGTLFLFNGFFAHRMIVGHLGYQVFMLLPWIALLLLRRPSLQLGNPILITLRQSAGPVIAGILISLLLQAGFSSLMVPGALTVLAIACLYLSDHQAWRLFLYQSAMALSIALALSASKISAVQAFLGNFPRNDYLLPGINGIIEAVKLLLTTLFLSPSDIERIALSAIANMQWTLVRQEWEFGVSFIPVFMVILSWGDRFGNRIQSDHTLPRFKLGQIAAVALLGLVLIVPLAVNIYTPAWNAFLKTVPLLKNSSTLTRWWIVYIPITIVYATLAFEKLSWSSKYKNRLAIASVLIVVLLNATQNRASYHNEPYNPAPITTAYLMKSQDETFIPEIQSIAAIVDAQGQIQMTVDRNDLVAYGQSQLACYNPTFGYRLEHFPVKSLHPGSIYDETNGYLNLKNPACYLFPLENHCRPGDHFLVSQNKEAKAFAHYKPFSFQVSSRQAIANNISITAVAIVTVLLVFYTVALFI